MSALEPWLAELRGEYVREAAVRLAAIEHSLRALEAQADDAAAWRELRQVFHAFAGSGTTYGFADVTAFAEKGERRCLEALEPAASSSASCLGACRGFARDIADVFARASAETASEAVPAAVPEPASRTRELLVVSGDAVASAALIALGAQEGMSVTAVDTLNAALEAIARALPDVVIADAALLDGSGHDVVRGVRARVGGDQPTVLVLAAHGEFVDKVEAIQRGADGFLEKPIDPDLVARRLQLLGEQARAAGGRILCVDDDALQVRYARTVLEAAGYAVDVCTDPRQFESALAASRPDLVLMDIVMPGMSGYDLARFVRQDERYATLPIVFLSTEAALEAQVEGARAGADAHLAKPVSPALLLSTVISRVERALFLRSLLNQDGLTRLLTHSAFAEQARTLHALFTRDPARRCVWVMLDVDHFKQVNDRYGHPVGDRVLVALASLLRRRLRRSDRIGRYGGEEFAILLEDVDEADARRLVTRLLQEFSDLEHGASDGASFRATFSAGVARLRPDVPLDAWRKAADDALYAAKRAGRARVETA